jgi:hypothetical protein
MVIKDVKMAAEGRKQHDTKKRTHDDRDRDRPPPQQHHQMAMGPPPPMDRGAPYGAMPYGMPPPVAAPIAAAAPPPGAYYDRDHYGRPATPPRIGIDPYGQPHHHVREREPDGYGHNNSDPYRNNGGGGGGGGGEYGGPPPAKRPVEEKPYDCVIIVCRKDQK